MIPKNIEALLSKLTDAVAEYAYENDDKDFEFDVHVYSENGWCKADKLIEKGGEQ